MVARLAPWPNQQHLWLLNMKRCQRDWIQPGMSWQARRLRGWIDVSIFSGGPTARLDSKSFDAIQRTWGVGRRSLTFQVGSLRRRSTHSLPPETPYRGSRQCLTARTDADRRRTARVSLAANRDIPVRQRNGAMFRGFWEVRRLSLMACEESASHPSGGAWRREHWRQ